MLHEAHQGMVQTKQHACLTIYWPGLDNDIDSMVSQCTQCQTHLPSHPKEPLISKPRPAWPFQEIAADFCYHAGRITLFCGLFHKLANSCSHGQVCHFYGSHYSSKGTIQLYCCTRCVLVRQWTSVHLPSISEFFYTLEI